MEEKSILLYPQLIFMNKQIVLLLFFLVFQQVGNAQILTESNLPIIVINSNGEEITSDGKVDATMKIYYKEDGSPNSINDVPN